MLKKIVISIVVLLSAAFISCSSDSSTDSGGDNGGNETVDGRVLVEAGSYIYSNGGGGAKSSITVDLTHDYYIDKYEVTVKKFCDMLNYGIEQGVVKGDTSVVIYQGQGVCYKNNGNEAYIFTTASSIYDVASGIIYNEETSKFELTSSDMANLPMNQVNYSSAAFYCNMLSRMDGLTELYTYDTGGIYYYDYGWYCNYYGESGYRLPTRAEWKFAYKGGNSSKKYEFSGSDTEDEVGWYWEYTDDPRHNVGQKKANELGIFDMTGNIAELCADHFGYWTEDYYVNPVGGYNQENSATVFLNGDESANTENFTNTNGFRVIKYTYSNAAHNMKPTCEISSPSDYSGSFDQGDVIKIAVKAADSDGTIEEVKIYFDDVFKGSAEYYSFHNSYYFYLETDGVTQGTHIIKAVAIDNEGGERIDEHNTNFTDQTNTSPTAAFTVSPSTGDVNTVFEFDASGCTDNENGMRWLTTTWDFDGNGSIDSYGRAEEIETHQFTTPGTYSVIMEVEDTGGRTNSITHKVTVTSK